jgi:hypothetical protein
MSDAGGGQQKRIINDPMIHLWIIPSSTCLGGIPGFLFGFLMIPFAFFYLFLRGLLSPPSSWSPASILA